jgi:hypothetical protein
MFYFEDFFFDREQRNEHMKNFDLLAVNNKLL